VTIANQFIGKQQSNDLRVAGVVANPGIQIDGGHCGPQSGRADGRMLDTIVCDIASNSAKWTLSRDAA
jgi:hypothetical protein